MSSQLTSQFSATSADQAGLILSLDQVKLHVNVNYLNVVLDGQMIVF